MFTKIITALVTLMVLAPSSRADEKKLELKDLGFAAVDIKPDEERQLLLNRRTHKLKTHEVLGPAAWGLMTATLLTAPEGGKASGVHQTLGILTAATYLSAAYFAWTAPADPKAPEEKTNLKIHETLQWVHLPLMILTPIAGLLAQKKLKAGQNPTGLGEQKGTLATALYATYTASFAVMLFDF